MEHPPKSARSQVFFHTAVQQNRWPLRHVGSPNTRVADGFGFCHRVGMPTHRRREGGREGGRGSSPGCSEIFVRSTDTAPDPQSHGHREKEFCKKDAEEIGTPPEQRRCSGGVQPLSPRPPRNVDPGFSGKLGRDVVMGGGFFKRLAALTIDSLAGFASSQDPLSSLERW